MAAGGGLLALTIFRGPLWLPWIQRWPLPAQTLAGQGAHPPVHGWGTTCPPSSILKTCCHAKQGLPCSTALPPAPRPPTPPLRAAQGPPRRHLLSHLLYILILPLEWIRLPFFSQETLGAGTPSAWQAKRAVPARGLVKLSGHSTNEGGAARDQASIVRGGLTMPKTPFFSHSPSAPFRPPPPRQHWPQGPL